ncbi:MAG: single-stranded-DNA-specific exonuclease RecJ [Bacteroidetes bacterium]|nr:single-stranded-DNA-specific exonuclease RecJ [Bacteroidota bacterium]
MNKKWVIKSEPPNSDVEKLKDELKVNEIIIKLLLQKGIDSREKAEEFFRPKLDDLHDPFSMKDMKNAVELVNKIIQSKKKILLFGDYDVDGTTAVSLMYLSLLPYYSNISYYIPDRYTEGYGVSKKGIDYAIKNEIALIISLDCGIKSVELIQYARENNIEFVVCDHHQPGEEIPNCVVLDPKQKDCKYQFKELSGCGVGFKLLQALYLVNNWNEKELLQHLDLVAISIGADIVSVTGENRILAKFGLKQLNEKPRTAFKELIELSGKKFPLSLTDVVFIIAPRINAAGRLRSGKFAVDLMISTNHTEMVQIAEEINQDNKNRREIDKQITEEALRQIENDPTFQDKKSTVVYNSNWHKGVVGIVASRLIEKHYRPTIVLTKSNGLLSGSARSIDNFNLYQAIDNCSDLLEQFGGHEYAAGLTLKEENLSEFIIRFNKEVEMQIGSQHQFPSQIIDLEINFENIFQPHENRKKIPRLKTLLDYFEPHGPGNMTPVFLTKNLFSKTCKIVKENHLKLECMQPSHDLVMEAIAFKMKDKENLVAKGIPFQIAYSLEVNSFRDQQTLQFNVKDIREH